MKRFLAYTFLALFASGTASAFKLPSKDFLKRGLQHCTGYCDSQNIKCEKGINKKGYYDWCKKNCLHKKKTNREDFVEAIKHCDKKTSPAPKSTADKAGSSEAKIPNFSRTFLGKIVDGDAQYGFKVVILAQKESGGAVKSGEHVFLHPDKTFDGLQVGNMIEANTVSKKELPAHSYGRLKFIQDVPKIVK